jgi:hypothetical protein
MVHVFRKPSVQFWGVLNWVIESEKYINMDLVLICYGVTAENWGNTYKITDSLLYLHQFMWLDKSVKFMEHVQ